MSNKELLSCLIKKLIFKRKIKWSKITMYIGSLDCFINWIILSLFDWLTIWLSADWLLFWLTDALQDPQDTLKDECREDKHCQHYREELERCTERVTSRSHTEENCSQELFDFIHCVDHCVRFLWSLLGVYFNVSQSAAVHVSGIARGGQVGISALGRQGLGHQNEY